MYAPLYALLWVLALLPFWALYLLGDILFFPLFYIVKYRRKLVFENMRASFPDLSDREVKRMEKKFYRHLCDYAVETVKLLHVSDRSVRKRFEMVNIELLQESVDNREQVILMLGHFGNWEYIPSIKIGLDAPEEAALGEVYRPLNNKWFDSFFLKLRSRFGTVNIPKRDVLREMIRYKRNNIPAVIGFMADQTPSRANIYYWTEFLNHKDTPVLTGIERIAKKLGCTLVYTDVIKVKRGYYKIVFEPITKNPSE